MINMGPHNIELDEGQRQMLLLALAHLAVERPGWTTAIKEVAGKMDNLNLELFWTFFRLHSCAIAIDGNVPLSVLPHPDSDPLHN